MRPAAMPLTPPDIGTRHPGARHLDLLGEYEAFGEVTFLPVAVRDDVGRLVAGLQSAGRVELVDDLEPLLGVIAEVRGHEYLGETFILLGPGQ